MPAQGWVLPDYLNKLTVDEGRLSGRYGRW